MKYVFFGTPAFAAGVLGQLIAADISPSAIVCNPDRPIGRKHIVTPPPTKLLAQRYGIPVLQPEKLSEIQAQLESVKAEFFVVAAYAKIIPKEIIDIAERGAIGVHPSLLPKYRGSSPIQAAILEGERQTGVTLYLLDEKMDHGSILAAEKLDVENRSYRELEAALADVGGKLLAATLPRFLAKEIVPHRQNETEATYTKKFKTDDGYIDEKDLREAVENRDVEKANIIERKVRALNPEPGVWTLQNGTRTKILEAVLVNGRLKLIKIQREGKNPVLLS